MLINEANFQEETKSGVVVVDFYTDTCPPCKRLAPIFEQLTGAKLCKVNASQNQELCAEHGISSVPTLLFFKDGVMVKKHVGLATQAVLQEKINSLG